VLLKEQYSTFVNEKVRMSGKINRKPREPERDYSHRLLLDKLGVKLGQRIGLFGIEDPVFLKELAARIPDIVPDQRMGGPDIVFLGADDVKALRRLKSLAATVQKNGAIWVVYPKGQKHIREADVMAAGRAAGLTDNKVCRFSETHTALRFVIPLARR
jgi:hypothetical protein